MMLVRLATRCVSHQPVARRARAALSTQAKTVLQRLDLSHDSINHGVFDGTWKGLGDLTVSTVKATGETLGLVATATPDEVDHALVRAREAYEHLRAVPAPRRGEVVRQIRAALADKLDDLGALVSLEMGKILPEGRGEVQEGVDISDYAVGLSRMMHGRYLPSERVGHQLLEHPNPLGVVGVISAFNFPSAVHMWNWSLSFVSGNATVWAPAPTTPLVAIAQTKILAGVLERNGIPPAAATLLCGGREVGKALAASPSIDLLSFTGSEAAGKKVAQVVAGRFGKLLLELGGNNAIVVMPDADMDMAVTNAVFGAIGTAGQRCTSTRRLFLHVSIVDDFCARLVKVYGQLVHDRIGDPLEPSTLVSPLHSSDALEAFHATIAAARAQGGSVLCGGKAHDPRSMALAGGIYAEPTVIRFEAGTRPAVMQDECFAPVLFVQPFGTLDEAIRLNNSVRQGLSSSIFTRQLGHVHRWLGPQGSDCGIVNVNASTSGAEIGAGFGGNKATGWGRESGGDAWKQYSRWSSVCINHSDAAPLAQGITFG